MRDSFVKLILNEYIEMKQKVLDELRESGFAEEARKSDGFAEPEKIQMLHQ